MSERLPIPDFGMPECYQTAFLALCDELRQRNPDQILTLGDSVLPEAKLLEESGFPVNRLSNLDGLAMYQRGSADEQMDQVLKHVGIDNHTIIVEDLPVSGGKLYQLKNSFEYAGVPFEAIVLAANANEQYPGVSVISSEPGLITALQLRASVIRESRKP